MLACFDASAEVLLPCVKASHMRRIGVLQKNKYGVAKAIMVEFGHNSEVFRIASALKNILRAFFQLLHQAIQPLIGSSGHASTLPFL